MENNDGKLLSSQNLPASHPHGKMSSLRKCDEGELFLFEMLPFQEFQGTFPIDLVEFFSGFRGHLLFIILIVAVK